MWGVSICKKNNQLGNIIPLFQAVQTHTGVGLYFPD